MTNHFCGSNRSNIGLPKLCQNETYDGLLIQYCMRKCAICGVEINGTKKYCNEPHSKNCQVCGNEFSVASPYRFDKVRVCSKICGGKLSHNDESHAKRRANSLERYGVEAPQKLAEVKAKASKTNQDRYGADWPNQNNEVRERGYKTNEERYGASHPLQSEQLREKAQETLKRNHGVTHPSQSPELRQRAGDSIEKRYGVRHAFQSEEIKEAIKAGYKERFGFEYPSQVPEIRAKILSSYEKAANSGKHGNGKRVSKLNLHWQEILSERFPDSHFTLEKAISGKSFDLAVEDKKLLIELNPTVTHNSEIAYVCLLNSCELPCEKHFAIGRNHHYERAKLAQTNGYSLVQVYDWDTEEKILKLLAGRLDKGFTRYSSRKLSTVKISSKIANEFLKTTHIQGGVSGQEFCYGLYADKELLAVATFGKARFGAKAQFEWLRYAVKANTVIHGGPNRLFSKFVEDSAAESVISYVDFDHSTAPTLFLEKAGFVETLGTGATLNWSKNNERIAQTTLLKLGADRVLKTSYGSRETSGLDNTAIMLLEKWLPVYTAGNRIFNWIKPVS